MNAAEFFYQSTLDMWNILQQVGDALRENWPVIAAGLGGAIVLIIIIRIVLAVVK